jgi:NADPH:quinone reductase-like Zn-dependent oxidoreductase
MKCFELQGPDGIEGLKLIDKPKPMPGPGQVLVRVKAATLNYRDLLTVKGGYGSRQKFSLIPVSDGAGVVETTGPDVGKFVPGDRVVGSFFETWIGGEPTTAKMRGALDGSDARCKPGSPPADSSPSSSARRSGRSLAGKL